MTLSAGSVEPIVAPALRACALFRNMDDGALAEVAGRLRHRRFRRHEVIFHAGDPGDALFIVVSGSLKIVLPSPEGNEAIIATLRPGDFFGELAVLDGEPRSATAVALEPDGARSVGEGSVPGPRAHPAGTAPRAADRPCGRAASPHGGTWRSCTSSPCRAASRCAWWTLPWRRQVRDLARSSPGTTRSPSSPR